MAEFELPEKTESRKERVVGLIIAAIAVVLAIVSAVGHETHNDEILTHVDAADQFAFYQAKKDRQEQLELSSDALSVLATPATQVATDKLVAGYQAQIAHLQADETQIHQKGTDLMNDSQQLSRQAGVLDLGEIALQISVVLCSITILTEQRLFVRMGVSIAVVGVLVAMWGVFLMR